MPRRGYSQPAWNVPVSQGAIHNSQARCRGGAFSSRWRGSRRAYDALYLAVISLTFPLYWLKVADWRLCSPNAEAVVALDPWLQAPPPPAWVAAFPCGGSQWAKLAALVAAPGPFLQALLWPICASELHFFVTFHLCTLGGAMLLLLVPERGYVQHPFRLLWALASKSTIKLVPIAHRLLRRAPPPWPRLVADALPAEGAMTVFFAVAFTLPPSAVAVSALLDQVQVAAIAAMHSAEDWPFPLPRAGLVAAQAVAGAAAVALAAALWGWRGGAGAGAGASERAGAGAGDAPTEHRAREPGTSSAGVGVLGAKAAKGAECTAVYDKLGDRLGPGVGLGLEAERDGADPSVELLEVCRRLMGSRSSGASSGAGVSPISGASSTAFVADLADTGSHGTTSSDVAPSAEGLGQLSYRSVLSITHVTMKIEGAEPSDLLPGYRDRLAAALAAGPAAAAAAAATGAGAQSGDTAPSALLDIAVRAGCVELHFDVITGAGGGAAGAAAAAAAAAAPPGPATAPAAAEQQALASSILAALGLPPGFASEVRAQVGAHLMTLTPAAAEAAAGSDDAVSAFGGAAAGPAAWAVLGSRRLAEHELPYITMIEPPAVAPEPAVPPPEVTAMEAAGPDGSTADGSTAAGTEASTPLSALPLLGSPRPTRSSSDVTGTAAVRRLPSGALVRYEPRCLSDCGDSPASGGGSTFVQFRLTVRGAAAALAAAAAQPDTAAASTSASASSPPPPAAPPPGLELVAMFDGAFLRVRDVQWEPLPPTSSSLPGDMLTERRLTARVALPLGRSGAVSLVLMRKGTSGRPAPLLLLTPAEAALAAEVTALQRRAQAAEAAARGRGGAVDVAAGPTLASLSAWLGDFGRWLQYRAYWLAEAARRDAVAAAAEDVPSPPSAPLLRLPSLLGQRRGPTVAAAAKANDGQRSGGGSPGRPPRAPRPPSARPSGNLSATAMAAPSAGSPGPPAARMPAVAEHMAALRRNLTEFAVEERCATVAAALLALLPLPYAAGVADGSTPAAAAAVAELAAASASGDADGLTLLHRAVRSGDAATIAAVVAAVDAVAAALAAAPSTSSATAQLPGWGTADAHGLTPLHYAAVLEDGGELPCFILGRFDGAAALWDAVGGAPAVAEAVAEAREVVPSPAAFAEQSGKTIDLAAVRAQAEWARAQLAAMEKAAEAEEPAEPAAATELKESTSLELARRQGRTVPGRVTLPALVEAAASTGRLLRACFLGFPCGAEEAAYRAAMAAAAAQGAGAAATAAAAHAPLLPSRWAEAGALAAAHAATSAVAVAQALLQPRARCRASLLPAAALQAGSSLIALHCVFLSRPAAVAADQPTSLAAAAMAETSAGSRRRRRQPGGAARVRAWVMVALSLAATATAAAALTQSRAWSAAGAAAPGGGAVSCGGWGLHQVLLLLYHAVVVALVPYDNMRVSYRLLVVQVVEAAACLALRFLEFGVRSTGGGGRSTAAVAGCFAAALLRGSVAAAVALTCEASRRAAFLRRDGPCAGGEDCRHGPGPSGSADEAAAAAAESDPHRPGSDPHGDCGHHSRGPAHSAARSNPSAHLGPRHRAQTHGHSHGHTHVQLHLHGSGGGAGGAARSGLGGPLVAPSHPEHGLLERPPVQEGAAKGTKHE
ncbi:hypothetical protein HYH03_003320 [Edaphochlamys debaryana]|uniref:Uncharacterized protein n=1 Tax=Edaphochlamys debaryana TaxID=47281 RepID=A0A835YBB4_9CHLO|nr:hypothetical protein HYH03_003320 [Edaphochlamys debaryana]|eukprot:KAG2498569.1 hypothetical protein HYH03_003320 [Edaphochlamys debaryana]